MIVLIILSRTNSSQTPGGRHAPVQYLRQRLMEEVRPADNNRNYAHQRQGDTLNLSKCYLWHRNGYGTLVSMALFFHVVTSLFSSSTLPDCRNFFFFHYNSRAHVFLSHNLDQTSVIYIKTMGLLFSRCWNGHSILMA